MFNEWGIGGCNKSFPFQSGMLGNGARFLGPSASNAAGSHSTQQQHQSQFNRSLWPATFQANGTEFTVPVTDSIFAATGGFTQSSNNSAPYLPLPLELVKNWNTGTVAFSQANSSIFVQSHTDFLNCTASTAAPQTQALSAKKTETCIGRWEHGSLIEPLQIHMPANPTITSYTTNTTAAAIKTENISSGSSSSGSSTGRSNANKKASKAAKGNKTINDCILNLHQQHQSNLVKTNDNCGQNLAIITTTNDNGCSRTVPITWTQAYQQYQQQPTYQQSNNSTNITNISANSNHLTNNGGCSSADTTTHHSHTTTTTLLQIKREPCQVSEVTTSNNLLATSAYAPLIKIEQKSPTNSGSTLASITSTMDNSNCNSLVNAQNSGAIPIGIAVGRQRLQESNQAAQQLQAKDLNRFGLSMADLGCTTTPNLSQNMFFTGTIPLTADVLQSHQSMAMAQNRTPPTLFQYPTMEIPMPPPPVGFQLVRDQSTGQILFLPTTTTIEPNTFQQAVVWPSYPQSSGASGSYQPPHLLLPSMQQTMQQTMQQSLHPPPLAPLQLLGSDYLTASTTLHQSHLQHTQTHSTRLVAISDTKRTKCTQQTTTVPMPIPSHTLIKIEDGHATGSHQNHHHHHQPTSMFEHEKSIQTSSIATAVQTGDLNGGQLYYQHPGLIQIAPHPGPPPPQIIEQQQECRSHHQISSSPLHLSNTNQSQSTITSDQLSVNVPSQQQQQQHQSEVQVQVQDANIQTSPVMSEDDNTSGNDEMGGPTEYEEESQEAPPPIITTTNEQPSSYEMLCQSVLNTSSETEALPKQEEHEQVEIPQECHESVPDSSCVTSSSIIIVKKMSETPEDFIPQTTFVESQPEIEQEYKQHQQLQQQQHLEEQREPVDLSGLQLLSNSIDVFHKKSIKQEPMDLHMHHHHHHGHDQQIMSTTIASTTYTPPIQEPPPMLEQGMMTMIPKDQTFRNEDLGGLNLLCALAEQRINEESSLRNREIEANVEEEEVRKRKHKHSSNPKKSSKKSKHEKEKKIKKRKHESSEERDDELNREMADTLKRVKTKYDPTQFSSVDDVFRLMENDMKEKLATITRQCEEKRRELNQIKPDGTEKECSSSSSSGEQQASQQIPTKNAYLGTTAPLKFSIIPALSPSFSSSSNSESLIVDIPKISSDTDLDDAEVEKSKRKYLIPIKHGEKLKKETIITKKQKGLVGYILAPKSKLSPAYSSPSTSSGVFSEVKGSSWTSSICKSFAVKQEEQDRSNILKESAFKDDKVFSIFGEKPSIFDTKSSQKFQASSPLTLSTNLQQRNQLTSLKHHSKHKKRSRSKDRSHRKDKKKIDSRCVLTLDHLKQEKVRVLTAQGGLFYAGNTIAITAPDIYAITLDGERRNQQHIMSREDLLKDAILEVLPKSSGECPTGTRLCAFWSQQYRCLYPGTATEPSSPDSETDEKFVNVEFDDGDNGRIGIEDIRFLPSDYPIVEYDPNPLQSLNKRKRQSSQGVSDQEKMPFNSSTNSIEPSNGLKREEKKRLKKMRKDKMKLQVSNSSVTDGDNAEAGTSGGISERKHKKKHKCSDELCKHRKHKKRRKHKKHHHREQEDTDELQNLSIVQNTSAPSVSNDSNNNEEEFDEDMSQGSLSMNDSVSQYEIIKKVDDPSIKEDTMNSSITESSGSIYQPKKSSSSSTADKSLNKSSENCSRIAAFLPARQLWAWSGKGFKRSAGRVKKQFYRAIQRGKETISVGDSAVFLSTGRPDRPYIGHIESMWETANNNMVVRVKWFYHPEETQGCPNLKYPGALFESPHEDENDVQTISHKCEVLNLESYVKKFGTEPKQYSSIYDNNDTYYLAGYYDPTLYSIKMESEIPEMPENEIWSISGSTQI